MPLPCHIPLVLIDAYDIHIAAHKAVRLDRNLMSDRPKLRWHNFIKWEDIESQQVYKSSQPQVPEAEICMHLMHPNGKWAFFVSSFNILRLVHLESGKLAAMHYENEFSYLPEVPFTFAVDFREENHPRIVLLCLPEKHGMAG